MFGFTSRTSHIQRLSTRIRKYSSQKTYPFAKLRAYPFCISPEDAIIQMAPYASYSCLFRQFVGSLGAHYLPGFGFTPFRPVHITPVYFPGWLIDAQVSADFIIGKSQRSVSCVTRSSYLPGSDFRVLSWVRYDLQTLPYPVPFTEELTHQHGTDVTCIPYTISPFAGFDLAQSATHPIQLQEDISFVPSSIRTGMFAAYPVLFPLYLAQYELSFPGKKRLVTLFIEAATPNGSIRAEKVFDEDMRGVLPPLLDFSHLLDDIDVLCLRGIPEPFFQFSSVLESRLVSSMINCWLNAAVVTHDVGPKLAQKSGIITSDADLRIRPYTCEEQIAVYDWLTLGQEIEKLKEIVALQKIFRDHSKVLHGKENLLIPELPSGYTLESLERSVESFKAKQDAVMPQWWKKWQHVNNSTSSHT